MARDEKQSGLTLPNNSVIVAALLATGTYWFVQDEPLRGSRPTAVDTQIVEQTELEEIDARLWQDPIGTVVAWRDKRALREAGDYCASNTEDRRCRSPLRNQSGQPQVLGITMSGARYPQDAESRRRTRYAVLAGLNHAGFVPVDPQHIDYFLFRPKRDAQRSTSNTVVPYEWFRSADPARSEQRVLVFWFNEDSLGSEPITRFVELVGFLRDENGTGSGSGHETTKVKFIGPEWSGTLQAMAAEACGRSQTHLECIPDVAPLPPWPGLGGVSFFTYSASAPDKQVLRGLAGSDRSVSSYFDAHGISLHRILAPDDQLADSMVRELQRRGVDPARDSNAHIALITEWDTLYGQTFPDTVKQSLFGEVFEQYKDRVHELRYLRGLDGQLPGTGAKKDRDPKKEESRSTEPSAKDRNGTRADTKDLERPDGQSQFDYLRRLAGRLHQIDMDLHRPADNSKNDNSKGAIKAIGVLGSDVFDKLLVLQALRPRFPETIFFTTDLDLSLTLPTELNWTRNLIVSSSFDLQLDEALQGETPPFRSAFQTAAFLATIVAVRDVAGPDTKGLTKVTGLLDKDHRWCVPARLFEIGRTGDLIAFEDTKDNSAGAPSSACPPSLPAIHPPIPVQYPSLDRSRLPYLFTMTLLIALFGLVFRFVQPLRQYTVEFLSKATTTRAMTGRGLVPIAAIVLLAVVSTELLSYIWSYSAKTLTEAGRGEPLTLLHGTSVWPTILLRTLGICLSIWFISRGAKQLDANLRDIARGIRIGDDIDTMIDAAHKAEAKRSPWERFARMFSYVILWSSCRRGAHFDHAGQQYDIGLAWRTYVYQERVAARSWRIAAWLAFSFLLVVATLWEDSTNLTRGAIAQNAYLITTYLNLLFVMILVIFVFDATLLFWFFVNEIRDNNTDWPKDSRQFWESKIGVDARSVDDWIDLEFMAKRTKCIADLVYYPFVVIGLTILSCSTTLAHFPPTLPFLVIQGAGLLVVSGCAVALRMAAESAREAVKGRLEDKIEQERDQKQSEKLRSLLSRVERLREGAFQPWTQQPVVRALLLPLGTFGAATILDRVAILGL